MNLSVSNISEASASYLVFSGQYDAGTFLLLNYLRGKNGPAVDLNNSGGTGEVPSKMKFLQGDFSAISAWLGEAGGTLQLDLTRSRANNDESRSVEETADTIIAELLARGFLFST